MYGIKRGLFRTPQGGLVELEPGGNGASAQPFNGSARNRITVLRHCNFYCNLQTGVLRGGVHADRALDIDPSGLRIGVDTHIMEAATHRPQARRLPKSAKSSRDVGQKTS